MYDDWSFIDTLIYLSVASYWILCFIFCVYAYGDPRDLQVLTHSFPTRRSSDQGQAGIGMLEARCRETVEGGHRRPGRRSAIGETGGDRRRAIIEEIGRAHV